MGFETADISALKKSLKFEVTLWDLKPSDLKELVAFTEFEVTLWDLKLLAILE